MNKEEAKQYLRNQINSSIKIQSDNYVDMYQLCHNKNYLSALKLSKITGTPVNKENFSGGKALFWFNTKYKTFWICSIIRDFLEENHSIDYTKQCHIVKEVINEYKDYKGYKHW